MGFSRLTLGLTHLRIWKHRQLKYEDVWLGIGGFIHAWFSKQTGHVRACLIKTHFCMHFVGLFCMTREFDLYNSPGNNARVSHNGVRLKPWFHYHISGWNCSFW